MAQFGVPVTGARSSRNPILDDPAFTGRQETQPLIDPGRLSFAYPNFGAGPGVDLPVAEDEDEEPTPTPAPTRTRGVPEIRAQYERDRGGDRAGEVEFSRSMAGKNVTKDPMDLVNGLIMGAGIASGPVGAALALGTRMAEMIAGVKPYDYSTQNFIGGLFADDDEPEQATVSGTSKPGKELAGSAGVGGYGTAGATPNSVSRGFTDPGVAGVPGGLTGRGAASTGGFDKPGKGGAGGVEAPAGGGGYGGGKPGGDKPGSEGGKPGGGVEAPAGGGGYGGGKPGKGGVGDQQGGSGTGSDSGCFITTAVCETLGMGDDCEPLQVLRRWRDEVLKPLDHGPETIAEYYDIAPGIVEAINARPDRDEIYRDLWSWHIAPAIAFIKEGKDLAAFKTYRHMVESAQEQFLCSR